jgi:hypothetical protein
LVEEMRAGSCQSLSQRLHHRAGALGWLQGGFRVASGACARPESSAWGLSLRPAASGQQSSGCAVAMADGVRSARPCRVVSAGLGWRVDVRVWARHWHWHWRCQHRHRHPSLDGARGPASPRVDSSAHRGPPPPPVVAMAIAEQRTRRAGRTVWCRFGSRRAALCACTYLHEVAVTCMQPPIPHPPCSMLHAPCSMPHAPCTHILHVVSHTPNARPMTPWSLLLTGSSTADRRAWLRSCSCTTPGHGGSAVKQLSVSHYPHHTVHRTHSTHGTHSTCPELTCSLLSPAGNNRQSRRIPRHGCCPQGHGNKCTPP